MSSINLMPSSVVAEAQAKKEKTLINILVLVFLLTSLGIGGYFYYMRDQQTKASAQWDGKVKEVEGKIESEVRKSETLSNYNRRDITQALADHLYLSRGLDMLKTLTAREVYLNSMDFKPGKDGTYEITLTANAKTQEDIIRQVTIYKDSFWVDKVDFKGVEAAKDISGTVAATLTLTLKKDLLVFQDTAWVAGANKLASLGSRNVKFSNLSVRKRSATAHASSDSGSTAAPGGSSAVINFSGTAFGKTNFESFKKTIEGDTTLENVKITESGRGEGTPGSLLFSGSMGIKY